MRYVFLLIALVQFSFRSDHTITQEEFQSGMIVRLNDLRSKKHSLKSDPRLKKAAQLQLEMIVSKDQLTHKHKERKWSTVEKRVNVNSPGVYFSCGENILYYDIQEEEDLNVKQLVDHCFNQWKASPSHLKNMKNKTFTHVGHAFTYHVERQRVYAVQVFGGK